MFDVHHAGTGVSGVRAVGVTLQQLGKIGKGIAQWCRITAGDIVVKITLGKHKAHFIGGQRAHVIGVIDLFVQRMQTDKALGGGQYRFQVGQLVLGVNHFQLGLFGIGAKGVAGFQLAQPFQRNNKVIIGQRFTRLLVIFLLGQFLIAVRVAGAGSK